MIRTLLVLSLAGLLLFTPGCGKKPAEEKTTPATDASTADTLMIEEVVPGDVPVWEKGVPFNENTMKATISIRSAELHNLYLRNEKQNPGLRGMLTLHFLVHPDGGVSDVTIKESNWNAPAGEIVADSLVWLVEQWTFPPGVEKPVGVTQPWSFVKE